MVLDQELRRSRERIAQLQLEEDLRRSRDLEEGLRRSREKLRDF